MNLLDVDKNSFWTRTAFNTLNVANLDGCTSHVAWTLPRTSLRKAASTFSDFRSTSTAARFDEITLQLLLKMCHVTQYPEADHPQPKEPIYQKVYLMWIPHKDDPTKAVAYQLHCFLFDDNMKYGKTLDYCLKESSALHKRAGNRSRNSRKPDELSGLQPWQKWKSVSSREMYVKNICDRVNRNQIATTHMDVILNPKMDLAENDCPANPLKTFSLERAVHQVPENAHPDFRDIKNYQVGESVTFPQMSYVIRLTPDQLQPRIFTNKYLLEYQNWIDIWRSNLVASKKTLLVDDLQPFTHGDEPSDKIDVNSYNDSIEREYDIRTSDDIERDRKNEFYEVSDFVTTQIINLQHYKQNVQPFEGHSTYDEKYKNYQQDAWTNLETRCLDADANISDVGASIINWSAQQPVRAFKNCLFDPDLSPFGNRVARMVQYFEDYLLVSTSHRMLYLIMCARYDAYRRDFDLHLNIFQTGEGATSKSFNFKLMQKASIPGTVEVLTYQTTKADAVDGNRNDLITVCHEAPPGMFRTSQNKNMDSSGEAMFKEKLTSQTVSCKTFYMDETSGKRSTRVTKSECIGVWFGATNDPPSEVEEALQTRFFWANFERTLRRGRDIDDCMHGENLMSPQDKQKRRDFFQELKQEQEMVFLVEKAIMTHVIKDVNTTACNVVIPMFKKQVLEKSIIRPGPRDWKRVNIFARNQAIVTAIEIVFKLPGGKHYGQPFQKEMVLDLEPYLVVTEEHVIFALSLFADQFRSPVEHKILHLLYNVVFNSNKQPEFPDISENPDNQQKDYNYIKLDRTKRITKQIYNLMPMANGRTSEHNIENFFHQMTRSTIKSPEYEMSENGDKPQKKEGSTCRIRESAKIYGSALHIHVAHLYAHAKDNEDIIYDILNNIAHKFSNTKQIMTAIPLNKHEYYHFKTIQRKPNLSHTLNYKNILFNSKEARWITQTAEDQSGSRKRKKYQIERDIDDHCMNEHAIQTGKKVGNLSDIYAKSWDEHSNYQKEQAFVYNNLTKKQKKNTM